jgi:DNA-binding response OmpR family regulator
MASDAPIVLAVSQAPLMCDLMEDLLGPHGYAVEVADGPAAALDRVAAGDVELVLLDLGWPESAGLELCQRLRAGRGGAAVPIIALTELPADERDVTGFAVGPQTYLTKPFTIDELLATVARYCPAG